MLTEIFRMTTPKRMRCEKMWHARGSREKRAGV